VQEEGRAECDERVREKGRKGGNERTKTWRRRRRRRRRKTYGVCRDGTIELAAEVSFRLVVEGPPAVLGSPGSGPKHHAHELVRRKGRGREEGDKVAERSEGRQIHEKRQGGREGGRTRGEGGREGGKEGGKEGGRRYLDRLVF